jgi:phospholipid/cholesterol/gamma-HCH transport system ATP-binding protein
MALLTAKPHGKPSDNAIEVVDIWKSFGPHQVLKGVSLKVPRGSVRVILGGSGSGKTVIMKHMIGLLKPDEGEVYVFGNNIVPLGGEAMVEMRKNFGMVFQQAALFDSMTVFDNVAFPLVEAEKKISAAEIKERVEDKLEVLGLSQAPLKYPNELSGGMRKRVGLARALVSEPKIVLYDEPTTGLDPITTDNVDQMILEAKEKFGVTSVVISHDIASALKVADSVAFLHEGEIVADTTPAELRRSEHPFVKKFLSTWFDR